jgi:hypothetical protein
LSAFNLSGLLSVTWAIASRVSKIKVSNAMNRPRGVGGLKHM